MQGPQCARPLDGDVAKRRPARRRGGPHRRGQRASAGAGLDDGERLRLAELRPPGVEGPGQDGPEQRADLGTGEEVAARTAGGAAALVEPEGGVVERQLDDPVEPERPVPAGLSGDDLR
jgi:hypothetical protein